MRHRIAAAGTVLACLAAAVVAAPAAPQSVTASAAANPLDAAAAARFAALALKCLHQEYPNHISHTLNSAADVRAPHELTPAFYGCLDWHSDVHGHWLLVRLLRLYPDAPFAQPARAAIAHSLTRDNITGETAYLLLNRLRAPMRPQSVRSRLRGIAIQSGIKRRVTPHMLRHTAATLLIETGVDIRFVQRLLGHSSIATTEIYTHVTDEALRSSLAKANILSSLNVA